MDMIIEALHDPATEVCIIPEYLMDILVGNKPLTPTDKYFKSPSWLFFECRGIARDVPITVDKIEVHLDFYIYDILDFDLLLGYPLQKTFSISWEPRWNAKGKCFCHCCPLFRKSHGEAFPWAELARGDGAYISVRIIRPRSLGSSRILWRIRLVR